MGNMGATPRGYGGFFAISPRFRLYFSRRTMLPATVSGVYAMAHPIVDSLDKALADVSAIRLPDASVLDSFERGQFAMALDLAMGAIRAALALAREYPDNV